jgi:hypothetical protein
MIYSSLEAGCFKMTAATGNAEGISSEDDTLGCTGMVLLSFEGDQLHRTPLAACKTKPLSKAESWRTREIFGSSSTDIFYPHSGANVAFVAGRRGFVEAIDITKPIGPSMAAQAGSKLTPLAISGLAMEDESPGIIVAGLEGEIPVLTASGTDIYSFSTFQRAWKIDMSQGISCGNVQNYFQSVFDGWAVPPGQTRHTHRNVWLKAKTAKRTAKAVSWLCELTKKALDTNGTVLHKDIACCNPKKSSTSMQCCVFKGVFSGPTNDQVQAALGSM